MLTAFCLEIIISHLLVKEVRLIVQTMRTSAFLGEFLFRKGALDGYCYSDPQLVKMQITGNWGVQPQSLYLRFRESHK